MYYLLIFPLFCFFRDIRLSGRKKREVFVQLPNPVHYRELFNDLFFVVFSGISGSQAGPGSKKKSVLSIAQPSIGDQDHYHEIDTDGGNFPFHFGAGGAL